jgi:hypothetical protein
MVKGDRAELVTELGWILDFNESQTNQDFTSTRLKKLIQWAYKKEINKAKQEGNSSYFCSFIDFTWESDLVTLSLPETVRHQEVLKFFDVTDSTLGSELLIGRYGQGRTIFWAANNKLQWGTDGPGSDRIIRAVFLANAETLIDDESEPELIPPQFRELLLWSAAIIARKVADDDIPQAWAEELNEARIDFWAHVSRGRPYSMSALLESQEYDFYLTLI